MLSVIVQIFKLFRKLKIFNDYKFDRINYMEGYGLGLRYCFRSIVDTLFRNHLQRLRYLRETRVSTLCDEKERRSGTSGTDVNIFSLFLFFLRFTFPILSLTCPTYTPLSHVSSIFWSYHDKGPPVFTAEFSVCTFTLAVKFPL